MADLRTAEEHIRNQDLHAARMRRDMIQKAKLENAEAMRDDVLSIVKNSGLSDIEIYARCGPVPKTLENWRKREVKMPRLGTLKAVLEITGHHLAIVGRAGQIVRRY